MKRIMLATIGAALLVGWLILTLIISQWAASQWRVTNYRYNGDQYSDGTPAGILMFLVMVAGGALIGAAIVREYINHDH